MNVRAAHPHGADYMLWAGPGHDSWLSGKYFVWTGHFGHFC
jgi:hypothetical protein